MGAANFDSVASPYRWMEYATFGPYLERCRGGQLAHIGDAKRALVLGDGDGRFLGRLLRSNSALTADVVDSSRSMLRLLDRRVRRSGDCARDRIRLYHADALSFVPRGQYDLIVSHFFLDCLFLHEIEQLFDRLAPALDPRARWLLSEFFVLPNAPQSYLSAFLVGALYRSFGMLTGLPVRALPGHESFFLSRGSELTREKRFLGGLLRSQLWTFPS